MVRRGQWGVNQEINKEEWRKTKETGDRNHLSPLSQEKKRCKETTRVVKVTEVVGQM